MEIDYIKAHMVIERYVQGKLGDDEEAAFEERLAWDMEMQEEVELAETMRSWLQASAKERKYSIPDQKRSRGWAQRLLLQPGYAAAASFVLGILITFSAMQNLSGNTEFGRDSSAPSVVLPLVVTRSASNDPQEIPVSPGAVTLLLVDVPYLDRQYSVTVRDSGNEVVWQQGGLTAGYLDAVAVGVPGGAVPPGDYMLFIESIGADFSQEIPFRSVDQE